MPVGDDDTVAEDVPAPAPAAALEIDHGGEVIAGRYRIVRWLGSGGMGRVYEALDTELGERVALKMLRGGLTEVAIERFRREVKLTRRIQHKNVARMFDIGEHAHDRFLTMELIDGAALARELGTPMAWPRLAAVAIQLCAGLAAAHDAGVVHRDLKPDNVLVERGTERIVITDFGIARSGDEVGVTQVGALIGTPRYMAPEQLAGERPDRPIDHRADLFALGVMLYELATGSRPWSGDHAIAIAVAQATSPPPTVVAHVPPAFAAVIGQCLALDIEHRPRRAADIAAAIAAGTAVPGIPAPGMGAGRMTSIGIGAAGPVPTLEQLRPQVETTAVAVLPVACAPDDAYLADGLLDDLVDTLASAGTLRVRPAGMARSQIGADPRELGRALAVDHVAVATLRRTPGGLRVTVRLISVADGFQIWTQRLDGIEAEILAIADQLGRGMASALSARAAPADRPTDPRAVDLYLRARAELRRFWGEHVTTATALLEDAARYAPTSPPILGALAFATVQSWIMGPDSDPTRPDQARRAQDAVDRALATGHGEAFLASAILLLNQGDPEGGASALGRALARAPMSAQAHESAGRLLLEIADPTDAARHYDTALGLDPGRGDIIGADLSRLDALQGRWPEAQARYERLIANPDPAVSTLGIVARARLAAWRRDGAGMLSSAHVFTPRLENAHLMLGFVQRTLALGHVDPAQWAQLDAVLTRPGRPQRMQLMGLQLLAEMALVLGDPDRALNALGRATEMGLIDVVWLERCPLFAAFGGDLQWRAIRDEVARRAERVLAAFHATAG